LVDDPPRSRPERGAPRAENCDSSLTSLAVLGVVRSDEAEHLAQDAQGPEDRSRRYGRAVRFDAVRRGEHARQGPQIVLRHFLFGFFSLSFLCAARLFSFFMSREKTKNKTTTKTKQQKERKKGKKGRKEERKKERTKRKNKTTKRKKERKMKRQKEGK
jgi:hypothetical protein